MPHALAVADLSVCPTFTLLTQTALNTQSVQTGCSPMALILLVLCREEDSLGDISTLADPSVVQQLLDLRGK